MSFITKRAIGRRTALRGLGASLALPLLDAMVPALTATARTAARSVQRFGVFYVPNGMSIVPGYWTPSREGSSFELTPILRPLAPYRDRLVVLSGLTNRTADPLTGEGAGDHSRAAGCFLTGVHVKKTQGGDFRADRSVDQVIAREASKYTQLSSLEIGLDSTEFAGACDPGYSCIYQGTIAWRTPTTPLPMENDPRAVFERLFGASGSTDARERLSQIRRDRSLLDAMTEGVARLQGTLGPGDRIKLAQYLDGVRDLERRLQKAEDQNARDLPHVEQPAGGVPPTFSEHIQLMFDLVTLAYQADLTRVFTFMLGREMGPAAYPESGVADGHHSVSHHQNDPDKLQKLSRINAYHVQTFTYFLDKLKSTMDGESSLLDQSLIIYGGGISNSDKHTHDDLPILLLGGAGGQLSGGRHVRVPTDTPLTNLLVTALNKMGMDAKQFGDSTGPLTGV